MGKKLEVAPGFALIEALVMILVLAVIGFGGYYIWNSRHPVAVKKASSTVATTSPTQTAPRKAAPADPNQGYFVIKDWGIRAKYAGDLTLDYTIPTNNTSTNQSGQSYQYLYLSSAQLDASNPLCVGGGYGGALERYAATSEFLMGDGNIDSGKTAAQYAATLPASGYGHVGNYYYFEISPQGACGESAASQNFQSQTRAAFMKLLPNFEAVPNGQ